MAQTTDVTWTVVSDRSRMQWQTHLSVSLYTCASKSLSLICPLVACACVRLCSLLPWQQITITQLPTVCMDAFVLTFDHSASCTLSLRAQVRNELLGKDCAPFQCRALHRAPPTFLCAFLRPTTRCKGLRCFSNMSRWASYFLLDSPLWQFFALCAWICTVSASSASLSWL